MAERKTTTRPVKDGKRAVANGAGRTGSNPHATNEIRKKSAQTDKKRNVSAKSTDVKKNVSRTANKNVKKDVNRNNNSNVINNKKTVANKKKNNGSEVMALSVLSFVLNSALTIIFYVVVVIAIVRASKYVYNFGYEIFGNVSVDVYPGKTVNLVVEEGETTMNVASKLELNKVIKNKYSFYIRTKLSEKDIYPGTYQVNTSMNYEQILDVIANYDTALENLEKQAGQNGGTVNSN